MLSHNTLCIEAVNTPCIATGRIDAAMPSTDRSDRLRDARQRAGFSSAAEAAQRFGWSEPAYRHHENGTRNFGPDAARRYGRAFRVKPGWLLGLESVADAPSSEPEGSVELVVNGAVAAGVWRESESWDDERRFVIKLPSPIPGIRRFGLLVEGFSMDQVYEPGTVLDCISTFHDPAHPNGVPPKDGDHVIVERIRPDGLRELTVKEYREEGGRLLLVPRSSRPEFKPLEYPGPDREIDPATGEVVRIIGFVVAPYPPRAIELLRRTGLVEQEPSR
ncbi:MAG TPA: XRE family transcriptional regulator [Sphingomicrobium sp.]|jgi:SOS-response transcriptional repressor LexA|nr:XRE family transcriptional regulator [Sphingomicrobium sp.]